MTMVAEPIAASRRRLELAPLGGVVAVLSLAAVTTPGLFVLAGQVPPFVATFATFVFVQGGLTAWTRGAPSGDIPQALGPLGSGRVAGLPTPVWIFAVQAMVAGVVLSRTTLGRRAAAIFVTGTRR